MADPKSTNKFKGSETKFDFYTDLLVHANSYANNLFANNLTVETLTIAGEAGGAGGAGGGGSTVLVNTANGTVSYNTNTNSKSDGAVVNIIFEENPGKTGHILTNTFSINISANNLIKDPSGTYLSVGDTIEFQSVISNLRLISDGEYWYLSGDNTMVASSSAAGNTYVTSTFVSNSYAGSTFSSNTYLQAQLLAFEQGEVSNTYLQGTFSSNTYLQAQLLAFEQGEVSNTYLQGTFSSNTYLQSTFSSNTYLQSTFSSNTYLQGTFSSNSYVQNTFSSNSYVQNTFSSNTYLQAQLLAFEQGEVSNTYLQSVITNYASNNYSTDTFTSNNFITGTFVSNTYFTETLESSGGDHLADVISFE
jgi:hypothetical protein